VVEWDGARGLDGAEHVLWRGSTEEREGHRRGAARAALADETDARALKGINCLAGPGRCRSAACVCLAVRHDFQHEEDERGDDDERAHDTQLGRLGRLLHRPVSLVTLKK